MISMEVKTPVTGKVSEGSVERSVLRKNSGHELFELYAFTALKSCSIRFGLTIVPSDVYSRHNLKVKYTSEAKC